MINKYKNITTVRSLCTVFLLAAFYSLMLLYYDPTSSQFYQILIPAPYRHAHQMPNGSQTSVRSLLLLTNSSNISVLSNSTTSFSYYIDYDDDNTQLQSFLQTNTLGLQFSFLNRNTIGTYYLNEENKPLTSDTNEEFSLRQNTESKITFNKGIEESKDNLYFESSSSSLSDVRPSEQMHSNQSMLQVKHREVISLKSVLQNLPIILESKATYLGNFKNPCWFQRSNLRCVPYFFMLGQPKCGTTDLTDRINEHPQVTNFKFYGGHWLTRKRYLMPLESRSLFYYMKLFHKQMHKIQYNKKKFQHSPNYVFQQIYGDESPSTFWDSHLTRHELRSKLACRIMDAIQEGGYRGTSNMEGEIITWENAQIKNKSHVLNKYIPSIQGRSCLLKCKNNIDCSRDIMGIDSTMADIIYNINPNARLIIILREPVARLYSAYLYFRARRKSARDFHIRSSQRVAAWKRCITIFSESHCASNQDIYAADNPRLQVGLYSIYLKRWLKLFKRDQLLVIRSEDYKKDILGTLKTVFQHLQLRPLTKREERRILKMPLTNVNKKKKNYSPILPETLKILKDFYLPYNLELSKLLNDTGFTWSDF